MKRSVLFLFGFGLLVGVTGCGSGTGSDLGPYGSFCGPVLAEVDAFMAGFADQVWPEERYGGMAVVGSVAPMRGFSPRAAGTVASAQHMQFVTHMTLLEYDEELEFMPYLAESWEVSEDQSQVTFHLRDDVFWHDGHPTTAEDVAFTFRVFSDPASLYGNQSFYRPYLPEGRGVEVLDDYTVRFTFEPHADYLETWRGQPIFPQHLLGAVPLDSLHAHPYTSECPVGNGPFRFLFHGADDSWTFEASPAFPSGLGGRPPLDRYVYRTIPEHATLQIELEREGGGLDAFVQMLPNQAASARENSNLSVWSFSFPSIFFVAWNSRIPQLADARVRRALTLGIDRRGFIDAYHGSQATLINSGLPPDHWAFDSSLEDSLAYDPQAAGDLLVEAGWVDQDGDGVRENAEGVRLEIELIFNQNQERSEVADFLRVAFQGIGVELKPRVTDQTTYEDIITGPEKAFDAALVTFETGFRIDERDLFHSEAVEGPYAFSGTIDPELDRFLDTLQLIPDQEEAREVWRAYQLRIMEVHPYTFLYSSYRRDGLKTRIKGAVLDMRGDWASIRHWWIDPQDRRTP